MVVPQVAACSAWLRGTRAGCTVAWVDRQTHRYMAAMLRLIPVCSVFSSNTSNGLYPLQNSQQTDGYRSRYHPGAAPGLALVGFLPARYHSLRVTSFWFPWGQRGFSKRLRIEWKLGNARTNFPQLPVSSVAPLTRLCPSLFITAGIPTQSLCEQKVACR